MQALFEAGWFQLTVKIILSIVVVLVLAIICGLILPRLRRRFYHTLHQDHTIHLRNQGNVTSVFHLIAESVEPLLTFQLFQNGIPLAEVFVSVEPATIQLAQPQTSLEGKPNPEPSTTISKSMPARIGANPMASIGGAGKAGEKVIAKTGAAASLLGILGGLLPGDLGKTIKDQGNAVRGMQTKTKDIMDKPQAMQRKLDQVQKDTGKLGVKSPTLQMPAASEKLSTEGEQPESSKSQREHSSGRAPAIDTELIKYFSTGEVEPGETVELTLRIGSKRRTRPAGSFLYHLKSQQVPVEKFEKKILPVTKQGVVNFEHFNPWRFFIADGLSALVILAGLLAALFGISLVW